MIVRFGAIALLSLFATTARAGDGLDVDAWLRKPGVKMLAVEIYATWCKPCMEAVPRWKALHEKYREQGLRLIVISTRDPGGSCVNPGWNPDDIICDEEGTLADSMGASALPAAFLWSWQGRLLVRRGHVQEVEAEIERYLKQSPRVDVQGPDNVRELIRERLRDEDKLEVVATKAEQAALDKIKAESFGARYNDQMQCQIGMELSANSMIQARITGSANRQQLALLLLSAEKGCLIASASVPFSAGKPKVSVAEAVTALLAKIRTTPDKPSAAPVVAKVEPVKVEPPAKVEPKVEPRVTGDDDDSDGIANRDDLCPKEAETINGFKDEDGCPDEKVLALMLPKLQIKEQIHFETAKASIAPASYAVLDSIAEKLKGDSSANVRVECHTDSMGASAIGLKLTEARAQSVVQYLVKKGIAAGRLSGKGYGETMPIADNKSSAGRAKNRRCEFVVL